MTKRHDLLVNLQIERFVAAAIVVMVHVQHEIVDTKIPGYQAFRPFHMFPWEGGVDIFFVLSGFMMVLISGGSGGKPSTAWNFMRRRFLRITPMYWLFTLLMMVAMVTAKAHMAHTRIEPKHVLASFAYVPWPDPKGAMNPILGVGWTLNYEMFFYAVFAVLLLFPAKIGRPLLFVLLISLVVLGRIFDAHLSLMIRYWSRPIICEFLYGAALALVYDRGIRIPNPVAIGLVAAGTLGLFIGVRLGYDGDYWRFIGLGVPAFLITSGFALGQQAREVRPIRFLHLLGDASYALYLLHMFTINIVSLFWTRLSIHSVSLYIATCMVVSIVASVMVHVAVERPLLSVLSGKPDVFLQRWRRAFRASIDRGGQTQGP